MSKTFLITGASAGLGSIFAESIANIARNIIISCMIVPNIFTPKCGDRNSI